MADSEVFHNEQMNICERVPPLSIFYCTSCDWSGVTSELAVFCGFNCCPDCYEFDVRVRNTLIDFGEK